MVPTPSEVFRRPYLDGLRGVAACMVFFAHLTIALLPAVVTFSASEVNTRYDLALGISPLAIIWAGNSAVCIFFVLSGFVLSDFCTHTTINFPAQVVRRYFRLALPMLITSAFALLLMLPPFNWGGGQQGLYRSFDAATMVTQSGWLSMWYRAFDPSFYDMAREALFGAFVDGKANYNSNLWTMQIELVGSILIFLLYALFQSKYLRIAVACGFVIYSKSNYYSLFAVGVVYYEMDGVARRFFAEHVQSERAREVVSVIVLCLGVFMCSFPFISPDMRAPWHAWLSQSTNVLAWHKIGAVVLVAGLMHSQIAQNALSGLIGRYLGHISFVLYLVHLPIICSLTAWLVLSTQGLPYFVTLFVAGGGTILAVFALSTALYKYVDVYTTSFSRHAGKLVDRLTKVTPEMAYPDRLSLQPAHVGDVRIK